MEAGTVSAHVDAEVMAKLKQIAVEEDRSVSWLVGQAVKLLIEDRQKPPHLRGPKIQAYASTNGVPPGRQVHLEDAIAQAVKRGPARVAKRK